MSLSRRTFLATAPCGAATLALVGQIPGAWADEPAAGGGTAPPNSQPAVYAAYPAHDPALVRDMVGASHARIERVRELLAQQPELARAAWDWGFGDWETALGAASHVGNRDIAALLIAHGARPDIFTFAMLGHLEAVKACIAASPGVQRIHGPHGLTLLHHARAGGPESAAVVEYLTSLGDADTPPPSQPTDRALARAAVGEYAFGPQPEDRFIVALNKREDLTIQRAVSGTPVNLRYQGENAYAPVGAPTVRVRFETGDGKARALVIESGGGRLRAERS